MIFCTGFSVATLPGGKAHGYLVIPSRKLANFSVSEMAHAGKQNVVYLIYVVAQSKQKSQKNNQRQAYKQDIKTLWWIVHKD